MFKLFIFILSANLFSQSMDCRILNDGYIRPWKFSLSEQDALGNFTKINQVMDFGGHNSNADIELKFYQYNKELRMVSIKFELDNQESTISVRKYDNKYYLGQVIIGSRDPQSITCSL